MSNWIYRDNEFIGFDREEIGARQILGFPWPARIYNFRAPARTSNAIPGHAEIDFSLGRTAFQPARFRGTRCAIWANQSVRTTSPIAKLVKTREKRAFRPLESMLA